MKKFNLILVRLGHFNLSIASFFIQFIFTLAIFDVYNQNGCFKKLFCE